MIKSMNKIMRLVLYLAPTYTQLVFGLGVVTGVLLVFVMTWLLM